MPEAGDADGPERQLGYGDMQRAVFWGTFWAIGAWVAVGALAWLIIYVLATAKIVFAP